MSSQHAIAIATRLTASQAALFIAALARSLECDDMAMPELLPSGVISEWQDASAA
jgi:hypothetical protein